MQMLQDKKAAFIAKAIAVHGDRYDYTTSVFTKSHAKIDILCPLHGVFSPRAKDHISKGSGCPTCAGKKPITNEEFVTRANTLYSNRYDYSEAVFTRSADKIKIICPQHGPWWPTANNHLRGQAGCPDCAGNLKLTAESFITKARKVHGDKYDYRKTVCPKNSKSKVSISCAVHGDFHMTPNSHLTGQGCPKCAFKGHITYEYMVSSAVDVHGSKYDYSETVYERANKKLTIGCNTCGNKFKVNFGNHILQKQGCPFCAGKRITTEDWIATATKTHSGQYDYTYSQYFGAKEKVLILCPEHGPFWSGASSHANSGHGCPKCWGVGPSKGQTEVYAFVDTLASAKLEVKLPESRYRYDILVEDHNIAIEYSGLIWHSARYSVDTRKDYKKHKLAESLGVRVMHIFEDEWLSKRSCVERLLLAALGKLPKVQARKFKVFEVPQKEADSFYEENHIQGKVHSPVNIALTSEEGIVACMSFSVLRSERTNKDRQHWELTRYASIASVTGGARRLLKKFLDKGLAHTVTSYSDNRLFSGKMYEVLGFAKTHTTRPDYFYTDGHVRRHKAKFQKKHLAHLFPGCDLSKTEREICEANGWYQLFDCGKTRWDYTVQYSKGTINSIDSHPSRCSLRPG